MALLRELIRDEGRMEAAEMLGVNYKTLAKTVDTGILSRRMSHALERLLLSGGGSAVAKQQERIQALEARSDALEKEVRSAHAAGEVEVKALREEHAVAIEEVRQRLTQVDRTSARSGYSARAHHDCGQLREAARDDGCDPAAVSRAGDRRACSR